MTIRSTALLLVALIVVGCGPSSPRPAQAPASGAAPQPAAPAGSASTGPGTTSPADPAGSAAAAPVKPVPPNLPGIVARVNGEAISSQDLEQAVRALEAQVGQPVPIERRDAIYRQMLDELIGFRLLVQSATTEGLTVTEEEVEARFGQVRGQFPSEPVFAGELARRGMTVETLRQQIRSQIQVGKVMEKHVAPGLQVTDQDVSTFYEQNPSQFQEPEAVEASHILIRADEKADDDSRRAARTMAEQLLARARKGEEFAALAREYSQDPGSAANGGQLGLVAKGQTAPAFEAAAFAATPGELAPVVQTPFGFHVLKVARHRAARVVPLAEATDRIRQFLLEQRRQQKTVTFVQQLRASAAVEILM